MTQLPVPNPDWAAFCQLVQQLIAGNVKRNTFTQWEMDLLLDLQMTRIRKSSRPEILRRYLKSVQLQTAAGDSAPRRFSQFFEDEIRGRKTENAPGDAIALPRAS